MPNSKKKTKPAPAKKHPPAKPAKRPPVKKPVAPAKAHSPSKPAPAKHQPAKPAPAKHQPPKAHVPSSPKPAKKITAKPEPAKPLAAKPVEPAKTAPKTPAKPVVAEKSAPAAKTAPKVSKAQTKADALRARILERRTAKPIAFTLDEVREIAKVNVAHTGTKNGGDGKPGNGKPRTAAEELEAKLKKAAQPHHVKPASLADILGYNPAKQAAPTVLAASEVDPKFQRYYKLLIDLREHVASGLSTHTEQTLKRSSKDDAGDLSSYAQHMADAGTDTFDRDFALSLVSNEQEALAEIEAAIQRIKTGTYGVCELTGKPISKERLLAVPFARFSVESQTEVERTKRRSASRAGLFGEGEEGGKLEDDGGGDE